MLFKLSAKNMKKSIKDYAIYFFTLILGVAIFYVFNAIESQTVLLNVTSSTYEIIDLMINMLSGVSVFVSFILGFLIIYASRFLMKRRNKEFAIYMLLGMSKRKISLILLIETLLIGLVSLGVGLLLGIGLSQLMSLLVANMFEADMTSFMFTFSLSACYKTLFYFGIMYVIIMIFQTLSISRYQLIDLLQSHKRSEKVKLKNPILSILVFIIASCMLGYAYYLVTIGIDRLQSVDQIFIPIGLGIVGTFLLFWSLSGLLLKIVSSMKKIYYKKLNCFTIRQIGSEINTTVFSMSMICLMLFVTICVLSSALSIKNSMTSNIESLAPVDIEFTKNLDMTETYREEMGYTEEQREDSTISIAETLGNIGFDADQYLTDVLDFNVYATNDILVSDTLGSYYEEAKQKYPSLAFDSAETFVRVSDYNKVAELYGLETITLDENQYVVVADFDQWIPLREEALRRKTPITLLGKTYVPKEEKVTKGFLHISSNHINMGFFVVPDDAVEESIRQQNILIANYKANSKEEKTKIENTLLSLDASKTVLNASSKLAIIEASVGLGALVTFIGLYLGIVFLISSAAILALKELSESSDNKERFQVLRKLGADTKMIHRALWMQIAIFFGLPLLIAMIHSIFGIIFCNYILSTFGNEQLLPSIIMTAIFLIFIYGGYFYLTYTCSKNMIKER